MGFSGQKLVHNLSSTALSRTYVRRMLPICVSTSSIYSIHPFSPLLVRGKFGSQNSIFDHSSSLIVSPCFLRTLLAIGDRLQSRDIVEESFEMQQPYLKLADYDHQLMQIHIHPPSPVSTNSCTVRPFTYGQGPLWNLGIRGEHLT